MIGVESGDVAAMRDTTVAELIDDMNAKQAQISFAWPFALCAAIVAGLALEAFGSGNQPIATAIGLGALVAILPAWLLGTWLDSYKRTSVLFYHLTGTAEDIYKQLTATYDDLAACGGKWHIDAGGAVRDLTTWKRNAGAAHLVSRKSAVLDYSLPKILLSNITPPAMMLGKTTLFFFPEIVIVQQGSRYGAVAYSELDPRWQESRFIEEGWHPPDARIVGETWKHPNKMGGPDRRFRDNRKLPVCLYETIHLSSGSGVNELAEFSKVGVVGPFVQALHKMPRKSGHAGLPPTARIA